LGDLDTAEGMAAQRLLAKTRPWTEKMYDWSDKKCIDWIKADDSNHILYIEYDYHQIGKDEKWFRDIANEIGDPLTVRREILLQRLKGSGNSPYAREDIDYIIDVCKRPIKKVYLKEYYELDIYEEFDKSIPYIVGVDCSTGTLGDNNAMTIIDPYKVEPVAEFKCSYIGETLYELVIRELVEQYIPNAIICIERNNVGDGIIDHLMYSPIAGNLYFDKSRDLQEEKMHSNETVQSMLKNNAQKKKFYGVYTQGNSRETMFAILSRHVSEFKDKFICQNIVDDLSRLVKKPSGKIEAGAGFHDDSIMSYLIGLYVYYHGDNLETFGLYKGEVIENANNDGLHRPDDAYTKNISTEAARDIHDTMMKEANKDMYAEELRKAIAQSQKESMMLYKKNLIDSELYDNTADYMIDGSDENMGSIDLDLFNTLNNF
jgi:hypothetical protein